MPPTLSLSMMHFDQTPDLMEIVDPRLCDPFERAMICASTGPRECDLMLSMLDESAQSLLRIQYDEPLRKAG